MSLTKERLRWIGLECRGNVVACNKACSSERLPSDWTAFAGPGCERMADDVLTVPDMLFHKIPDHLVGHKVRK